MISKHLRIRKDCFPKVTRGKITQNEVVKIVTFNDRNLEHPKIAVVVSNKISKTAVNRNLIRRRVYNVAHKRLSSLPNAYITFFPKKINITTQEVDKSIDELICLKK